MFRAHRTSLWLLVLILVVPDLASARKGRLIGIVIDPDGNPLEGVKATATSDQVPGFNEVEVTDKKGVFKVDFNEINVVYKYLAMPNGIVFSPDETRIYIADTGVHERHPDEKFHDYPPSIQCHKVTDDGKLGKKLFHIESGSDGMAVDVKGNLYTTFRGKVSVYDADGKAIEDIEVPEGPANVCFGGDDFKTLFITARTSLYSLRMQFPGAKPKGAK